MMSADEDPLAGSFDSGVVGKMGDDNPLALFDSGGDGDINQMETADVNLLDDEVDDTADVNLLDDEAEGTLEEYDLGDEEEDDSLGSDLLDMEGWSLRRHRTDAEEEGGGADDSAEEYGTDHNTPNFEANAKGERNNGRRGLFGGWGSNRGGNVQAEGNDLLNGDVASPAWSDTNASSSGRGGGFFGRLGSNNNNNNTTSSASLTTEETDASYSKLPRDGIDEAGMAYGEGGITGDDDTITETMDPELEAEQRMDNRLRPGDHIYVWQTYGLNPRAYQRHAVVFSVTRRGEEDPLTVRLPDYQPTGEEEPLSFNMDALYTDDEDDVEVTVVSFYHFQRPHASGSRRGKRAGCKREHLYDFLGPDAIRKKKPVRKVRYGRKVKKGLLSQKAGVGTALKKDRVGLILARVQYVLDRPDHLPLHNALSANGECASLWCVTGRWCTLQGASILAITSVGQAGGALLAGGILSNLTILVPMPGVWGMAGWWWYVPATVAYPFLVPLLVTLGMASLVPLEILRRNRKKWRGITDGLNHAFWSSASEAVKEEYFGDSATAEKEAEMRSFFGVREGESSADDSKYMPLGGVPCGIDDSDDDDGDEEAEDEAVALQQMEQSCQSMASDMKVDLSGRPPSESSKGAWGSFVGSFRGNNSPQSVQDNDGLNETQRFHTAYEMS